MSEWTPKPGDVVAVRARCVALPGHPERGSEPCYEWAPPWPHKPVVAPWHTAAEWEAAQRVIEAAREVGIADMRTQARKRLVYALDAYDAAREGTE